MNFGMPMGIIKFVSELNGKGDAEGINKILNIGLFFYLGVGLLVGMGIASVGLFFLHAFKISPDNMETARTMALLAAGFAVVSSPFGVFYNVLWGLEKQRGLAAQSVVVAFLKYVLFLAVVLLKGTVLWLIYATIISSALGWLINYIYLHRVFPELKISFALIDGQLIRKIFSFNVWSFILSIARMLIYQVDKLVIGLFLPVSSITYYDIAQKIHAFVRQIHGYVHGLTFVDSSRAYGEKNEGYIQKLVYSGIKMNIIIIVPIVFSIIIFARPFVLLWLGTDFLSTVPLIQLFVSYFLIATITTIPSNILMGKGEIRFFALLAIINGLFNLGLSIALVQIYGVVGVIWGTVIPYFILSPLSMFYIFHKINFSLKTHFKESIIFPYIFSLFYFGILFLILQYLLKNYIYSFLSLFLISGALLFFSYIFSYLFLLNNPEKEKMFLTFPFLRIKFLNG